MEHDEPNGLQVIPQHHALSGWAWHARNKAHLRGNSLDNAVGAAVVNQSGYITEAANIELPFRRGMHAEVSAISRALAEHPGMRVEAVLIAAERELFSPCGDCMDWIWYFGGPNTVVICENSPGHVTLKQTARDLMPFYPR